MVSTTSNILYAIELVFLLVIYRQWLDHSDLYWALRILELVCRHWIFEEVKIQRLLSFKLSKSIDFHGWRLIFFLFRWFLLILIRVDL